MYYIEWVLNHSLIFFHINATKQTTTFGILISSGLSLPILRTNNMKNSFMYDMKLLFHLSIHQKLHMFGQSKADRIEVSVIPSPTISILIKQIIQMFYCFPT